VPDIGDFKEVEVIEVMVKVGDTIKVDQSLLTVESDKADGNPIVARRRGQEVKVKVGDKVGMGSIVLVVEATGGAAAPALPLLPLRQQLPLLQPAPAALLLPPPQHRKARSNRQTGPRIAIDPQVRPRTGRGSGQVPGTGPKGRITQPTCRTSSRA
jgi:pyruvate dehydrogenase E2 component (dihydrolipoamide acetyltransferase)